MQNRCHIGAITIVTILFLVSCDCDQQAAGIVFERNTKRSIQNVSIGKYYKGNSANSDSREVYTNDTGYFIYERISGSFRGCPDLVLYFNKPGYKTTKMIFESFTQNDTVYLDKIPFNKDSSLSISLKEFDKEIDQCIRWLQTNQLKNITDEQHVQIMMCLNTILMRDFRGGHYGELNEISEEKDYTRNIITVYTEWIPNRGMGFYFPKLQMELYGTPKHYAVYNVTK